MALKIQAGVIGLGKFGLIFAETLVELGHDVIGVDKNEKNIKRAQQILPHVYKADASNKKALIQIGIGDCTHALVSTGQSISASTMISMYLKEIGVPVVWVKALHRDHKKLLEMLKVDKVIIPEHSAAREFANRMAVPGFILFFFGVAAWITALGSYFFDWTINTQLIAAVQHLTGKSFIELPQTDVVNAQPVTIEQFGNGKYGPNTHFFSRTTGDGKATINTQWRQTPLLRHFAVHDHTGRRAIGQLRGVSCGDEFAFLYKSAVFEYRGQ